MKYKILVPDKAKNAYIFNNNCIQIMKHYKNDYELHSSNDFLIQKVSENGDFIVDSENIPRESDVIYFVGNSIALLNKRIKDVRYFHTIKLEEEE